MHITKLPRELLVQIFSNVDDFSDKIRMERVCEYWRQIVTQIWEKNKTCPVPLNDRKTLGLVLNQRVERLEELWLQNISIDVELITQMASSLIHLKLSKCQLNGPATNSITDLFGQQLCSFILDGTAYHSNMRRLIENESPKLEHLSLDLIVSCNYSARRLPTKLPNNLKSFSLCGGDEYMDVVSTLLLTVAKDCKNLKILHLQIQTLTPIMNEAIRNIKSLVYLNLDVSKIDEAALKNVICHELANLKALRIVGKYSEEMISNICRDRPDLVHLNVFTRHALQIPDSLNSLTLRIPTKADFDQFRPGILFDQNKSIQHLDIRSLVIPSSSIKELLGQFPDLKSLHCKMPATDTDLTSFFDLIEKNLENGRKITIYFHCFFFLFQYPNGIYCKYVLPGDLPNFEIGWRTKKCKGKCENLVLKKLIKEAIDGGNEPSFLGEYWME